MDPEQVAVFAAAMVAFALVSQRLATTPLTMPMLFVAAGFVAGPDVLDVVDVGLETEGVSLVSEGTLAVILFADAVRIDLTALRREAALPARLLGIGLPLTVALGTGIAALMLPGISGWEAALIAAILAPTDAALGQAVVTNPRVPGRIRHGLVVESGLNDGLALPAVVLFLELASQAGSGHSTGYWVRFVTEQVVLGGLAGVVVGAGGGWLLITATRRGWAHGLFAQLATFSLAILALAGALSIDGNGFIAAFVAGLAFRAVAGMLSGEHLAEYTEDTGQLLAALTFFIFGNLFLGPAFENLGVLVVLCAVLTLTVGRMVPVAVAMIGSGARPPTVVFLGWFGPRGLASILFGLLVFEEASMAQADEVFTVVSLTVALSVVAHGMTAAWGARTYGDWYEKVTEAEGDEAVATMCEGQEVTEQRPRWAPRGGEPTGAD